MDWRRLPRDTLLCGVASRVNMIIWATLLSIVAILSIVTPVLALSSNSTEYFEPYRDLTNSTWTFYNETSGSTSNITFNQDGTYSRILHDNNLTGVWNSNLVRA